MYSNIYYLTKSLNEFKWGYVDENVYEVQIDYHCFHMDMTCGFAGTICQCLQNEHEYYRRLNKSLCGKKGGLRGFVFNGLATLVKNKLKSMCCLNHKFTLTFCLFIR